MTNDTDQAAAQQQRLALLNLLEDAEQLNALLEEQLAAAQALQEVSTQMLRQRDVSALYPMILHAAAVIMRSDMASMHLVVEGEEALRLVARHGFHAESDGVDALVRPDVRTSYSVARRSGRRVVVPDVEPSDTAHRQAGIRAVQSTPLVSRNGQIVGMISTHWKRPHEPSQRELSLMDVLARQAADLIDRQSAEDALVEAHRVKDQFLALLSHELRTPLSALLIQVSLLRRPDGTLGTQRGLDIIERAAKTQVRLIDDLLDISRITAGKLELQRVPVCTASIVREAIDLLQGMADEKSIGLETRIEETSGVVLGDPDRLRQVVSNLLNNAIKFTPNGGRVAVRAEQADTHVRIQVADTGMGIDTATLPRIFELFFQAGQGRRGGGLGLGLALVKNIVEHHGGTVQAESAGKDQGTTFTVTLPVIAGGDREIASAEPAPALGEDWGGAERDTALAGTKILVVEDDVATREAMQELLETTGARVQTAKSAADARHVFEQFQPDLLVSDIAMPAGEEGHALLKRLRALGRSRGGDVPAIALTARATVEDRRRAMDAGFQMHLAKPVGANALIGALVRLKKTRLSS